MTLSLDAPPRWAPPMSTVALVEAGVHWDAVAVRQDLGLAALAVLDQESERRPGPVIWDVRGARLYFLITAGSDTIVDARTLRRGTYVAVPGVDVVDPVGLCWIVPPAPDAPDDLVDPGRLASALHHVSTGRWVTRIVAGREVEILASEDQLAGRACLVCRSTRAPLHPGGLVTLAATDGVVHDYEAAVCTAHLEVGHGQ